MGIFSTFFDSSGGGSDLQTLTGNDGVATASGGNINVLTSNSTVIFEAAGDTVTLNFRGDETTGNLVIGSGLPSQAGAENCVGIGQSVLNSITTGDNNAAFGNQSLTGLTTGTNNAAYGIDSGLNLQTGSYNTLLGRSAGLSYTTSESSNICIGHPGSISESNTLRIGQNGSSVGEQNRAFMAGITGVTVSASAPVGINSSSQLSSLGFGAAGQVLTSTGAASSPTWQAPVTGTTASQAVASGSAISLTTATNANLASVSLAAGTWLVSGIVQFGGTPTVSGPQQVSISTTSATHSTLGDTSVQSVWLTTNFTVGTLPVTVPGAIVTVGATTTVYLVVSGVFSGGSMTAFGRISAVKIL